MQSIMPTSLRSATLKPSERRKIRYQSTKKRSTNVKQRRQNSDVKDSNSSRGTRTTVATLDEEGDNAKSAEEQTRPLHHELEDANARSTTKKKRSTSKEKSKSKSKLKSSHEDQQEAPAKRQSARKSSKERERMTRESSEKRLRQRRREPGLLPRRTAKQTKPASARSLEDELPLNDHQKKTQRYKHKVPDVPNSPPFDPAAAAAKAATDVLNRRRLEDDTMDDSEMLLDALPFHSLQFLNRDELSACSSLTPSLIDSDYEDDDDFGDITYDWGDVPKQTSQKILEQQKSPPTLPKRKSSAVQGEDSASQQDQDNADKQEPPQKSRPSRKAKKVQRKTSKRKSDRAPMDPSGHQRATQSTHRRSMERFQAVPPAQEAVPAWKLREMLKSKGTVDGTPDAPVPMPKRQASAHQKLGDVQPSSPKDTSSHRRRPLLPPAAVEAEKKHHRKKDPPARPRKSSSQRRQLSDASKQGRRKVKSNTDTLPPAFALIFGVHDDGKKRSKKQARPEGKAKRSTERRSRSNSRSKQDGEQPQPTKPRSRSKSKREQDGELPPTAPSTKPRSRSKSKREQNGEQPTSPPTAQKTPTKRRSRSNSKSRREQENEPPTSPPTAQKTPTKRRSRSNSKSRREQENEPPTSPPTAQKTPTKRRSQSKDKESRRRSLSRSKKPDPADADKAPGWKEPSFQTLSGPSTHSKTKTPANQRKPRLTMGIKAKSPAPRNSVPAWQLRETLKSTSSASSAQPRPVNPELPPAFRAMKRSMLTRRRQTDGTKYLQTKQQQREEEAESTQRRSSIATSLRRILDQDNGGKLEMGDDGKKRLVFELGSVVP